MGLQQELGDLRAEYVRKAPPGRIELYDEKVEELRCTFPVEAVLKTGDRAPNVTLPDAFGRTVVIRGVLLAAIVRRPAARKGAVPISASFASMREETR